jgi:hypothetical protein
MGFLSILKYIFIGLFFGFMLGMFAYWKLTSKNKVKTINAVNKQVI